MDMTKDKIEVGSKWVAKIDNPQGAGILTGAVVRVIEVDGIETIYYDYGDDLPAYAASILWYDYFKPYVEEPLLNLGYFDYPDIDDTGNIVDNVNSPSHYGQGKIEAIEYISDFLTKEEYQGYLRGNIAKYLHRFPYKNGIEDLKKARWYLERLIQEVE